MRLFDPFRELDFLKKEIDQAINQYTQGNLSPWNVSFPFSQRKNNLSINISENEDGYEVIALAPGLNPDSLTVNVLRNQVSVSGERIKEADVNQESYHRQERGFGKFTRNFTLNTEIDDEKVTAEYQDGVLKLNLPKAESAKPRQIPVSIS